MGWTSAVTWSATVSRRPPWSARRRERSGSSLSWSGRPGRKGRRPTTLTLESEVRFADLAARNAFAKELSDAVAHLVVKYHDAAATESPAFRVVVAAYPSPARPIGRDRERDTDHG